MRRRDFLLGGGAIVASVRAVLAQQPEQLRRIALLGDTPSDWAPWTVAFVGRLRELGWSEGFNIAIDYRWSEARPERLAEIVAELVKHKPDVIVTYGGAVSILKKATASIPIVFAIAVDPISRRPPARFEVRIMRCTPFAGIALDQEIAPFDIA